jgi:hypothetical protein
VGPARLKPVVGQPFPQEHLEPGGLHGGVVVRAAASSPGRPGGGGRGQAGLEAWQTPRPHSGSNEAAASPVASHPSPVQQSSRDVSARTTRNGGTVADDPTRRRVCGASRSRASQKDVPVVAPAGSKSASVMKAVTTAPVGSGAEYHQPVSTASIISLGSPPPGAGGK